MKCIYFGDGDRCYANPPIPALAAKYVPEQETKTEYCQNKEFWGCPRYKATIEYLKAASGK